MSVRSYSRPLNIHRSKMRAVIQADPTNNDAKMKLAEIFEILNEPRKALELVMQGDLAPEPCMTILSTEHRPLQSSTPASAAEASVKAHSTLPIRRLPPFSRKARSAARRRKAKAPLRSQRTSSPQRSCASSKRRKSARHSKAGTACRSCGCACLRATKRRSGSGSWKRRSS